MACKLGHFDDLALFTNSFRNWLLKELFNYRDTFFSTMRSTACCCTRSHGIDLTTSTVSCREWGPCTTSSTVRCFTSSHVVNLIISTSSPRHRGTSSTCSNVRCCTIRSAVCCYTCPRGAKDTARSAVRCCTRSKEATRSWTRSTCIASSIARNANALLSFTGDLERHRDAIQHTRQRLGTTWRRNHVHLVLALQ